MRYMIFKCTKCENEQGYVGDTPRCSKCGGELINTGKHFEIEYGESKHRAQ